MVFHTDHEDHKDHRRYIMGIVDEKHPFRSLMRTTHADHIRTKAMRLLPDLSEPVAIEPVTATSSLDFLRAIYSDPGQPMQRRMRAAIAALPFENPKMAVVASIQGNAGFASRLEAAIVRSRKGENGGTLIDQSDNNDTA